jgi:hypothetical protein
MQSSNMSSDHIPLNEVFPSESLYPSRLEIEAIEIPDCQEVFQRKATVIRQGQICSGHFGSKPTPSPTPSCQDELSSYGSDAFARNESGSSYISHEGVVNAPGPAPHTPLDRKSSAPKGPISRYEVEVEPGVFLPLHGSQETLEAMQEGQLVSCTCFVCMQPLMCVPQALYVLCPDCRVVSPVAASKQSVTLPGGMGGVGLGMKRAE